MRSEVDVVAEGEVWTHARCFALYRNSSEDYVISDRRWRNIGDR
jgi:hypothetical protein